MDSTTNQFQDTRESQDLNVTFAGTEVDFDSINDKTGVNTEMMEEFQKSAAAVDFRLPSSVNFIALRESLLSEAPFVTKSNKTFWRKMVDNYHYQNVLAGAFRHVLGCISDIGNVNIDKLLAMSDSPFTKVMATNVSEMIFSLKLRDRDQFFEKLPEITTFMIIEALHTSTPKHYRVYNSVRFREILLDWGSELIGGIRLSNCRTHKEWLFDNALDSNIMTSDSLRLPNIKTNQTPASSLFSMEHSPLVRLYMGMDTNKKPSAGGLGYKVALSHSTERPLTVMNDYALLRKGKSYNRKCDMTAVKKQLKETISKKNAIMKQANDANDASKADLRRIREAYLTYVDQLNNKKVSKAQLVQAMQMQASQPSGAGGNS
jgi:hypothetical protein